jgi:hypothetical protein
MIRWSLVLFWLCTNSLAAQPGKSNSVPLSQQRPTWSGQVQGYGLTIEDAKNDALKHLVEQMAAALRHRDPPLFAWEPTMDYVKRRVVKNKGKPGPDFMVENVGLTKTWIYVVKPLDWPTLTALDQDAQRAQRRPERVILAAQLFGAFTLALAVLTAYLRLVRRGAQRGSANR